MRYRYVIHCQKMEREEAFVVKDLFEMLRIPERYVVQFGPIDLLYNTGRV